MGGSFSGGPEALDVDGVKCPQDYVVEFLKNPNCLVIDCRQTQWYEKLTYPGALSLPTTLRQWVAEEVL